MSRKIFEDISLRPDKPGLMSNRRSKQGKGDSWNCGVFAAQVCWTAKLEMSLSHYSQSLVSTRRMLDFFNADELIDYIDRAEDADGV